jgi:hypothetical protein
VRQVAWVDVALLAREAGFRPGEQTMRVVAIAEEETRRALLLDDDLPVDEPDGSVSYGLMQCNSIHLRPGGQLEGWDPMRLHRDHSYNLAAALILSKGGSDFQPWTTYRDGLDPVNVRLATVANDAASRILQERTWTRVAREMRDTAQAALAEAVELAEQVTAERDAALERITRAREVLG